jgi:branched-chain amino acid transport system substrate-binding protein
MSLSRWCTYKRGSGRAAGRRVLLVSSVVTLLSVGLTATANNAAASSAPYTIGLVTDQTGPAASTYQNVINGVQARIGLQNAHGGVNGHQIKLVTADDATSPTNNMTAAQELISKGALVLIQDSAVAFTSARVMQQAGIPVVGTGTDGYEWGEQPYTNMFSLANELWDSKEPVYALSPAIWKGVKRVGSFGYSISPSSTEAATAFGYAAKKAGLNPVYINTSLPFGTVNATSMALSIRNNEVQGIYMPLDDNTNLAIITAARQAGVKLKVAVSATGYGQNLLDDKSAVQASQGVYFISTAGAPVELNTPATVAMQKALATYGHYHGVPNFGAYEGWLTADLTIKGLQVAGKTATKQSFIANLRKVTNYTGGGLIPTPVNFTQFGKSPSPFCNYYTILKGSQFVVANNGQPVCSKVLPNSNQAP